MSEERSDETCKAAANLVGGHISCDLAAPHGGLAHSNREHQIIWQGDDFEVRSLRGVVQAVADLADEWEHGPDVTEWNPLVELRAALGPVPRPERKLPTREDVLEYHRLSGGDIEDTIDYALSLTEPYETPRWDEDPIVIGHGWLDGRCGRCGEPLPAALAAAADAPQPEDEPERVECGTCHGSGCLPPTGTQPDGWAEGIEDTDPPPCPNCGGLGDVADAPQPEPDTYIAPDGREDATWMRPHRLLIESLPLPAETKAELNRMVDAVYGHTIEERSMEAEANRQLLGAIFRAAPPLSDNDQERIAALLAGPSPAVLPQPSEGKR